VRAFQESDIVFGEFLFGGGTLEGVVEAFRVVEIDVEEIGIHVVGFTDGAGIVEAMRDRIEGVVDGFIFLGLGGTEIHVGFDEVLDEVEVRVPGPKVLGAKFPKGLEIAIDIGGFDVSVGGTCAIGEESPSFSRMAFSGAEFFTELGVLDGAPILDALFPSEVHGDIGSVEFHVVPLQRGDAKGFVFFRVFVVPDAKATIDHETQDQRDLLFFGIALLVDVFLDLAQYFLIRFSKFNHMLEFGFGLLRDEGGIVGVLGATLGIITDGPDLGGPIPSDLDLVVGGREIESLDNAFDLGLPYKPLGIGVLIRVPPLRLLYDGSYDVVLHYSIVFKKKIDILSYSYMTDSMASEQPLRSYLTSRYEDRIMTQLNDESLPLYLREHYSESPNYYVNEDPSVMIETLIWLSLTETQKKDYLQSDLEVYMDS